LDGAGWIVPAQDPIALAKAMENALQQTDKRTTLGQLAHDRVARDFPLEETLRKNAETLA
jgi:glycosyltransferase involved in cell wall biosynthesis